MRIISRVLPLILALQATSACAQVNTAITGPDVMGLVRSDRWGEAQAAASQYLDPVVPKIVTYYRMMAPTASSYDEIAQFQATSPDWPMQASLTRRREEALATMTDDAAVTLACDQARPALAGALLRCAEAYERGARPADAAATATAAWIAGDAGIEARMAQWAPILSREAQFSRFDRLAYTDPVAARRQIARLDLADRPRAEARLALKADAGNAEPLLAALPADQRRDPGLVLDELRFLRRANRDDAAVQGWLERGAEAERNAPPERRAAFWDERNLMARRRLRQGDNEGAYRIAAGHAQTASEQVADAEFLAGFIALRKLNNPAQATIHFKRLAAQSKAAITQGRAHYWLARAGGGAAEYRLSAAWPNTFYGQLSLIALNEDPAERIRGLRDPAATPGDALAMAEREVARAAAYLVAWGEPRRAQAFLFRLDDIAPDPTSRALVARLAQGFGAPETAVALARRAGRDGLIQLDTGWPVAATIPADAAPDPALALAIIRQESSFDSTTTSPVGARGLMQLMPATAANVAKQLGTQAPVLSLTSDPSLNVRLGTTYLRGLLDQFGGVVPYAVAGYNAGPSRVSEWSSVNGDPRTGTADMIDWIELIPFGETRNYVQRVIENEVIYAARANARTRHPLADFLSRAG
jgi:soluble lytic murein transglycosylase